MNLYLVPIGVGVHLAPTITAFQPTLPAMGYPQVSTTVKIDTRSDREQTLEETMASVLGRL
jgi:uncharacterized protein YqgV (UPF0045/DUF77 family)